MKVKVLSPLKHDNTDYAVGDLADLAPKTVKALLASGTVELLPEPEPSTEPKAKK